MTTALLQQALYALDLCNAEQFPEGIEAMDALQAAIAQPVQPALQPLTIDELKALWNSQADHMNQWDELGLDEIVAFAQTDHKATKD